jgi:hypothetical protein
MRFQTLFVAHRLQEPHRKFLRRSCFDVELQGLDLQVGKKRVETPKWTYSLLLYSTASERT